jgi:hypothetical protein
MTGRETELETDMRLAGAKGGCCDPTFGRPLTLQVQTFPYDFALAACSDAMGTLVADCDIVC